MTTLQRRAIQGGALAAIALAGVAEISDPSRQWYAVLVGIVPGFSFILAGLDYARKRFHPQRFYLTVATFNNRARTVYARAGFVRVGTTTSHRGGRRVELIEMMRGA